MKHGGKRKGAGRKPGSGSKPPTLVIRIPKAILAKVKKLIKEFYKSKE
jgi:hypothetical protein